MRGLGAFLHRARQADAQRDAGAAAREQLARQQCRARRLQQRGRAVEHRRVARFDAHRQHRRAGGAGEAQEALPPLPVAHAAQAQARHFAGREDDHALFALQRLFDRRDAVGRGPTAEDAHRQQQRRQARDGGQQVIGDDAHVAAHAAHQVQQRQRVQAAAGVVGHDQHAARGRDALALHLVHRVARAQVVQRRFHQGQALQVAVPRQEGVNLVQPRQPAEAAQQRPRQAFARALEPGRERLLQAALKFDHGLDLSGRPPQRGRRR